MSFSISVRIKKVSGKIGDSIPFPRYATIGSAGLDLPACLDEPLVVPPGARMKIPTGIAIEIPFKHVVGLVFPRSGLATKHGISLANAVGVIDSDYKGEIIVAVYNQSDCEYIVNPGERVAQLLFLPVYHADLETVEELEESSRGQGGFGSTGKV
ncbi:MAG: Deoxyuridine 5'-triphosphate nucleotidohydrolase [Pelotomaculum sp. PtaB.Bin013]|uniref:Deoxyuridine 5'-triphosphate nucleotidohydrolase n=1 Tax=Pelotomaculum isophthalicicum JI TaxID=947010 RepID=A0A9X4GXY5_9FIRM|nr:dUTP diphosphatase [Pelotomaculum isophthalicicum]MDF9407295.1 dUTP diphosphatase [Pelotomaculum isophthalicicum JI]OPX89100.1 MAG: Deoxyuridine 5'-triphosphate nucleotidohydrolase [Pelotomaculum sp. PtaB.Bin013]